MCYTVSLLYVVILIYVDYGKADFMTKNANNYGLYHVEWEHYDQCRGPKMTNLTIYTTNLVKGEDNMYRGTLNVTFFDETRIDEIKMSVFALKEEGKTLLWNYIVNKPCQHYVLASLFESQLGVKNCVVKKGDYVMDLNLSTLMAHYVGSSFFYGDYLFKTVVLSKKGNIVCLIFDPKFKKIVKNPVNI